MTQNRKVKNRVIVGAQWGDEGKGKIVDILAARSQWVARYQGGNNAGHTLVVGGKKIVLHAVPSGVLHPHTHNVIGGGCVVDLQVLHDELCALAEHGHMIGPNQLTLAANAHLILPFHVALDKAREKAAGNGKIGTTGRGIGPAYEAKVGRRGIRAMDLLNPGYLAKRISAALEEVNCLLKFYGEEVFTLDQVLEWLSPHAHLLSPYIADVPALLHGAIARRESILFEGAQGAQLDVDHGDYPYVTSSPTVAANACIGTGVGPTAIDEVIGVAKAYATRVGSGPFPTEIIGGIGDEMRRIGFEYGATTGRPRRCGWFDGYLLKQAVIAGGITRLAVTKLDVLSGLGPIRARMSEDPCDLTEYEGWTEDISGCRTMDDLPPAARQFIDAIEDNTDLKVIMVGVGPDREQTIEIPEV
jgi:adenylosuccinate synthase